MAWTIELAQSAEATLGKLDRETARRILRFLHKRVAPAENPRAIGAPLKGSIFGRFWRYRVGDYRLICEIHDERFLLLVVRIGHRRTVYR